MIITISGFEPQRSNIKTIWAIATKSLWRAPFLGIKITFINRHLIGSINCYNLTISNCRPRDKIKSHTIKNFSDLKNIRKIPQDSETEFTREES